MRSFPAQQTISWVGFFVMLGLGYPGRVLWVSSRMEFPYETIEKLKKLWNPAIDKD